MLVNYFNGQRIFAELRIIKLCLIVSAKLFVSLLRQRAERAGNAKKKKNVNVVRSHKSGIAHVKRKRERERQRKGE